MDSSENNAKYVECPICSKKVLSFLINTHIDSDCDKFSPERRKKQKFNIEQPILSQSAIIQSTVAQSEVEIHDLTLPETEVVNLTVEPTVHTTQTTMNIQPLADRLRPKTFDELFGNEEIIGKDSFLLKSFQSDRFPSIIFWGPPGCGKTTIAMIIAKNTKKLFLHLSAVDSGVKDIQSLVQKAQNHFRLTKTGTILFIDEIHRYNKKQQDVFLPYVENGTFTLIGATTENPSFSLNSALLSRCRVEKLAPLDEEAIKKIINRALLLNNPTLKLTEEAENSLCNLCNGDARTVLNVLDQIFTQYPELDEINKEMIQKVIKSIQLLYDKKSDEHYDTISAMHKSIRGSDIQATAFYVVRMLEAGEDPLFIVRRIIRCASEDIGLADPMALEQAILAHQAIQYIGLPECKLAVLQAAIYCASAPKSNELDTAYNKLADLIRSHPQHKIPYHIRNAPTKLMKDLGYGVEYKYPPDFNYEVDQKFLPEELENETFVEVDKLRGFGRFAPND